MALGGQDSIGKHYAAERGGLVKYAARVSGDDACAEDIVQEAYLKLGLRAQQVTIDTPAHYLVRIIRNLAFDWRRRRQREGLRYVEDGESFLAGLGAEQATPETEVLYRQEYLRLHAALSALPEQSRMAVEMHRFGGLKLREIGEKLGVSTTQAHKLVTEGLTFCCDYVQGGEDRS